MSVAGAVLSPICEDVIHSPDYCLGSPKHCPRESIVIYLTLAGSIIPMQVMEAESIASVKLRIQTCKGFVVKKQKLVFAGRELSRNDSLVRDYGLADGNVLHLVFRISDLLVITVKTVCGREFEFHVERSRNIDYVKRKIARKGRGFINLDDEELICNGEKLEDQRLINDICRKNGAVIHLVVQKSAKVRAKPIEKDFEVSIMASSSAYGMADAKVERCGAGVENLQFLSVGSGLKNFRLEPVIVNSDIEMPHFFSDLVKTTFAGLKGGNPPIRSSEGSGGAYFMQDFAAQRYVSVFKPIDEEPMAVNNPQGLPVTLDGEGLKKGTRVGEGALREVAAYLLDYPRSGPHMVSTGEIGFSGVPPTIMIKCLHEGFNHPNGYKGTEENSKIGSLQMFVNNYGSCEDIGPRNFPIEEVHKISVLDIRLANADRHPGNILVCKPGNGDGIILVPIDHGYCLPESFADCTFDWMYWPQSRHPYSSETIAYIRMLDAEHDIALLEFYGWKLSPQCARTLRISTMLLKKGAERGLSPFTLGGIMCREVLKKASVIEEIVLEAQDCVLPGSSEAAFIESVSQIMDRRLKELTGHIS